MKTQLTVFLLIFSTIIKAQIATVEFGERAKKALVRPEFNISNGIRVLAKGEAHIIAINASDELIKFNTTTLKEEERIEVQDLFPKQRKVRYVLLIADRYDERTRIVVRKEYIKKHRGGISKDEYLKIEYLYLELNSELAEVSNSRRLLFGDINKPKSGHWPSIELEQKHYSDGDIGYSIRWRRDGVTQVYTKSIMGSSSTTKVERKFYSADSEFEDLVEEDNNRFVKFSPGRIAFKREDGKQELFMLTGRNGVLMGYRFLVHSKDSAEPIAKAGAIENEETKKFSEHMRSDGRGQILGMGKYETSSPNSYYLIYAYHEYHTSSQDRFVRVNDTRELVHENYHNDRIYRLLVLYVSNHNVQWEKVLNVRTGRKKNFYGVYDSEKAVEGVLPDVWVGNDDELYILAQHQPVRKKEEKMFDVHNLELVQLSSKGSIERQILIDSKKSNNISPSVLYNPSIIQDPTVRYYPMEVYNKQVDCLSKLVLIE